MFALRQFAAVMLGVVLSASFAHGVGIFTPYVNNVENVVEYYNVGDVLESKLEKPCSNNTGAPVTFQYVMYMYDENLNLVDYSSNHIVVAAGDVDTLTGSISRTVVAGDGHFLVSVTVTRSDSNKPYYVGYIVFNGYLP